MPHPSQETPAPTKAPNQDLKDMDVLCTFKIKIESPNLDHECVKDQWLYLNQDQDTKPESGTSSVLQSPKWGLKGHGFFCTFKIKIESPNSDHGYIKDQWPYLNQDQDARPKSETSSILQNPKWGLKGQGCSFHLKNQVRGSKIRSWMYQRPLTTSKSWSRCQTPVRNLQRPPKPQMRT